VVNWSNEALRWTQTFKPNAEPSFVLALLHGIALTVPAFLFAGIIEHKVTRLPLADALIERSVLESYIAARVSASSLFLTELGKILNPDELLILKKSQDKNDFAELKKLVKKYQIDGLYTTFDYDGNVVYSSFEGLHEYFNAMAVVMISGGGRPQELGWASLAAPPTQRKLVRNYNGSEIQEAMEGGLV
jgi:hypothetical protein